MEEKTDIKNVNHAIKMLKYAIDNVINSDPFFISENIATVYNMIHDDLIISEILKDYLNSGKTLEDFHEYSGITRQLDLKLPTNVDSRIIYLLLLIEKITKDDLNYLSYVNQVYGRTSYEEKFRSDILRSTFRYMVEIIDNHFEAEKENKNEIKKENLSITINHNGGVSKGNVYNFQSTIENITTNQSDSLVMEVIDQIKSDEIDLNGKEEEVNQLIKALVAELNSPDEKNKPNKINNIATSLMKFGNQVLLQSVSKVIVDERWILEAGKAIMGL